MSFLRSLPIIIIFCGQFVLAQTFVLYPKVVPSPGEIYTFKFIKKATDIDTSSIGQDIIWDFHKVKDTAVYYEEVYRETLPSQNDEFEDAYSIDSTSVRQEAMCWVNYLDSNGYYRLGAYEKPDIFESEIPYKYGDTIVLLKFPFYLGSHSKDRYEFIKGGRKHVKNQYVEVLIKYDANGTLILPNNDTCNSAIRIRREERFFHVINGVSQPAGTKIIFYWYNGDKPNYFLKVTYMNGKPFEAWYQKKKAFIKRKKTNN